jgi:Tfp pilus assembly protein PilX
MIVRTESPVRPFRQTPARLPAWSYSHGVSNLPSSPHLPHPPSHGFALVVAIMSMALMSALGAALMLVTSSETLIAANYRNSVEASYAADAIAEHAIDELGSIADWNAALGGVARSSFVDGAPTGTRMLAAGVTVDLTQAVNMANCGKAPPCSSADIVGNATGDRPWAADNPVWQLFAYGPLSAVLPAGSINTPFYVLAMIADDPSERDGDPSKDGSGVENPGLGIISLRAEAFGPRNTHRIIELTIARSPARQDGQDGQDGPRGYVRVLSWRQIR